MNPDNQNPTSSKRYHDDYPEFQDPHFNPEKAGFDARHGYLRILIKHLDQLRQTSIADDHHHYIKILENTTTQVSPYINKAATEQVDKNIEKARNILRVHPDNPEFEELTRKLLRDATRTLYNACRDMLLPTKTKRSFEPKDFEWHRFWKNKNKMHPTVVHEILPKKPTDTYLERIMLRLTTRLEEKDDDYTVISAGDTGTGKSTLMLHALDYYTDELSTKGIGMNIGGYADALAWAEKQKHPRWAVWDEANLSKREAMKQENRDTIDVNFKIRGANILQWWNNPSLDIIDKPMLKEKIFDLIIYIYEKTQGARRYALFTNKQALRIYEEHGELTLDILDKAVEEDAAWYLGWFREYQGGFWDDYQSMKTGSMESAIQSFQEKHGNESKIFTMQHAADRLDVDIRTFKKYFNMLVEDDELVMNEHFSKTPTDRWQIPPNTIDRVHDAMKEAHS